jgi:hypothetical protein
VRSEPSGYDNFSLAAKVLQFTKHYRFVRSLAGWITICMDSYIAPCNICIHHIHVDYAGSTTPRSRLMEEVESRLEVSESHPGAA